MSLNATAQDRKGKPVNVEVDEGLVDQETSLSHWKYLVDLNLPKNAAPGTKFGVLEVPGAVIGKANPDLADLRLTDATGKRLPYALRIQRTAATQTPIPIIRRFDAGPLVGDKTFAESFELAPVPLPGHNEIEIVTPGDDFRRLVQVLGSNSADFQNAQSLLPEKTYLVRFAAGGRVVSVNKFHYEHKLFRFLKVRVDADRYSSEKAPMIERVVVYQSQETIGKYLTYPVRIGTIQGVRGQGGPATAYSLILGEEPTFCEKLTLGVDKDISVERPFRLQIANHGQIREDIGGVEWRWRSEQGQQFVDLTFPELRAEALRLVITDFANPPLSFFQATGTMAARQLIFEWPDLAKTPLPLKLFFGNDQAFAPHFDLEKRLPVHFEPPPAPAEAGPRQQNPQYVPPEPDFAEKHPLAIYAVLGAACLVLAALLLALAKQAVVQV